MFLRCGVLAPRWAARTQLARTLRVAHKMFSPPTAGRGRVTQQRWGVLLVAGRHPLARNGFGISPELVSSSASTSDRASVHAGHVLQCELLELDCRQVADGLGDDLTGADE